MVCVSLPAPASSPLLGTGVSIKLEISHNTGTTTVHRSTTQGALWSIGAKSMPLLNTRDASYNSVAGSARCSGQTHVIETNGTLKNWFQYFSNLFLRRIRAETCLDRSLGKWWNRAGVHEVVFLLAFFIFPFPLFRFAISLFLAIKIFWLLVQNCAPVKQTQG